MVSVIIPVYNVEKYINKCVDSVINQTYKDLEIILVDDGSTDKSGIICDEYEKKDSRIKVIHRMNGGLSAARNSGIDAATGEYYLFIDSDDYVSENMIDIMYSALKDNDAEISVCGFRKVYDNGDEEKSDDKQEEYAVNSSKRIYKVFSGRESCMQMYNPCRAVETVVAWNKLYKSSLFGTGTDRIRYPEGKIHEDEFTTYKLLYRASQVVYVWNTLYYYVQRSGSITNDVKTYSPSHIVILDMNDERIQFYIDNNEKELTGLAVHRATMSARGLYMKYMQAGNEEMALKAYEYCVKIKNQYNKYLRVSADEKYLINAFCKNPTTYGRKEDKRNRYRRIIGRLFGVSK